MNGCLDGWIAYLKFGSVNSGSITDFGEMNHSVIAISDRLPVCNTLRWQTVYHFNYSKHFSLCPWELVLVIL